MRTTVEITPEQRAKLLELAARQGRKGFSHLVREALELFLARQQELDAKRKRDTRLGGSLMVREGIGWNTILEIDDALRERLERLATETGLTINEIVGNLLREEGAGRPGERTPFRLEWEPVSGTLLPGVDLDDRDAMIERMEGRS